MHTRSLVLAGLVLASTPNAQWLPGEEALVLQYHAGSFALGANVSDLASGDVDGDGDLDLLAADATAGVLRLALNEGGGFTTSVLVPGAEPDAVCLADIDFDEDLDIVAGLADRLVVLLNDGMAHFSAQPSLPFPAWDLWPVGVHVADVDGDGLPDAVLGLAHHSLPSGSWTGALIVARGDGAGSFTLLPTHELLLPAQTLLMADLDGDRRPDVAGLGGYMGSAVQLAFGQGDGTFVNGPVTYAAGAYAGDVTAGDWDGDGDVDLATGSKYVLALLLNDGTGAFSGGGSLSIGSYIKGLAAGDLDRDGDIDLAATSASAGALRLLGNDGAGHFAVTDSVPCPSQAYALLLADLSGDGWLDAWAGTISGQLVHADSACLVARYGDAKPSSLGTLPSMDAGGAPLLGATDFQVHALSLVPGQPALVIAGLQAAWLPLHGGQLLVAEPWLLVAAASGDGALHLPVSAAQLQVLGEGTRIHLQVWTADPAHPDGTGTSLTDGLWFEVAVP